MTGFLQICAALGGFTFIATPITALAMWRKTKAEAKKIGVDATAVLTDSAIKLLKNVQEEAEGLRRDLAAMSNQLRVVEDLLRQNGIPVPAWAPRRNGAM